MLEFHNITYIIVSLELLVSRKYCVQCSYLVIYKTGQNLRTFLPRK